MLFKCKICGGNLDVQQGERVVECEYCGVKQTLPSFIEPKIQEIYNRASAYLMHNEFDKAENLYNQILVDNKSDADAYWNILMCHYGVTYVKDPASDRYIPTCNRTLYTPIFSDSNYKNAVAYADEKQKFLYEENAKTIDKIQQGIIAVSNKEKPFDIFISYKETGTNGRRTNDSILAQELYGKLTTEGYKVFFSRITLEDKVGTEYEPYIYAALASSKVMITICSSKENIEAVWVKNEWSRFLSFMQKDSSKTIIPLYFDMDKADLPEDFAHIPSYDMNIEGFEQELIRGIKKLIPTPVMLAEKRKKFRKRIKITGLILLALIAIGTIMAIPWFMKLPEYNAAMQLYYDKNYPEASWAFAAMDGYRNSEEMQDKCDVSWRNSLASATSSYDYYVTANGTVKNFPDASARTSTELTINEHGKVVSVAEVEGFLASLHDDGYMQPMGSNMELTRENIIQVSPDLGCRIMLCNDGSMVCQDVYADSEVVDTKTYDGPFKEISQWKDIVSFNYDFAVGLGRSFHRDTVVIGVKKDGKLCGMGVAFEDDAIIYNFDHILNQFSNVKKACIDFDEDWQGNNYISVFALTKNNTIQQYVDGQFSEIEAKDVVDIEIHNIYDEGIMLCMLKSDGRVYKNNSNNYIMEDVIYMEKEHMVTRSGQIYFFNGYDNVPQSRNVKTRILPEWTERMN